ncbi:DMT family transporter [Kiloniella sp. b19]|uniref:DMT family transporter n=1 Tax=Kiloniella sp. GXU_MW_B19 TaxID=3141326 RepID=UPI0031D16709
MNTPAKFDQTALVIFVLQILIWGVNWPIMKIGLEEFSFPPFWFAFFRVSIGMTVLFAILAFMGQITRPDRRDLKIVMIVGFFQMALFLTCVNVGLLYIDAGRSSVLAYTTPLWITPASVLFLGEKLTKTRVIGVVLGLAGVMVLFNPAELDWSDHDALKGNGIMLMGAICWSISILAIRRHTWVKSTLQLSPWQMLVACVPLLIVALSFEDVGQIEWTPLSVTIILFNGVFATAFAFWSSIMVASRLPAVTTSLGFLAIPLCGVLFSNLMLNEPMTLSLTTGMLLIVASVAAVSVPWSRLRRTKPQGS